MGRREQDHKELIRAGAALSLSGRFSNQGEQARQGLVLWAEDLNAAGGMPVGRLKRSAMDLVILDDASRRDRATQLTVQLITRERVDLLFGPYSSVLTLAAAQVADRHSKVLWNHGGSSDALTERGFQRVVSVLSPASRYFVGVLEMARAALPGPRRLALVYGAGGTFPRAVMAGAELAAQKFGFEAVLKAPYPTGTEGMAGLVEEVAAREPDVVLGAGTTEADLEFARCLRRAAVKPAVVGLVATPIQLFRARLGELAEGFVGPSQWEPAREVHPNLGPTSVAFRARFAERFGAEPDYPAAQAYAAGLVAQRCVETAGTLRDAALARVACSLALTTFYGAFRLDEKTGEQVGHEPVVVQWQDGAKRVVWPPAVAARAPRLGSSAAISRASTSRRSRSAPDP